MSTTTVHGIHTTLHHALKSVVDQRLLPHNPADHVEPPKVAHKSMTILNEEQLDTFLAAVEQAPIWKDFFYTELTTGLRLGEICGLMWSDFDPRKGTLNVSRTLHKEKGGRLVTGDTKTCHLLHRSCCQIVRSTPILYGSFPTRSNPKHP